MAANKLKPAKKPTSRRASPAGAKKKARGKKPTERRAAPAKKNGSAAASPPPAAAHVSKPAEPETPAGNEPPVLPTPTATFTF